MSLISSPAKTVSVDERIDLSREVHAGSADAEARMLELVADALARWEAGERPTGSAG